MGTTYANPEGYKIPKSQAEVADRWFKLRADRLALEKEAARIEAEEKFLKNYIIDTLPLSQATGISGKLVSVRIVQKHRPEIIEYDDLTEFIARNRRHGAFALLNRAVNRATADEYWEAGKRIPGIDKVLYKDISYSSIK